MAEPTNSPLSDAAPPAAPSNTPEEFDNPPISSHPHSQSASIAAYEASGYYIWKGEDLPRGGGSHGGGRGGGVRNIRDVRDGRDTRDQVQTRRGDGLGQV